MAEFDLVVRGDAVGTAADWVGALEWIRGKVGVVTDLTPNCLQPNTRYSNLPRRPDQFAVRTPALPDPTRRPLYPPITDIEPAKLDVCL